MKTYASTLSSSYDHNNGNICFGLPAGFDAHHVHEYDSADDEDDRRAGGDRRTREFAASFPLVDCGNIYVMNDRRRMPDRRVNSIVVEWITDINQVL